MNFPRVCFSVWILGAFVSSGQLPAADVDFNLDIKPILSNRCFACHGPDPEHREAGLRLDTFEGATEDLGGYRAIASGKPTESELLLRVTSEDPDMVMPPPSMGKPLTATEVDTLRQWIAQGADYAPHWSYVPPRRVEPPLAADPWVRNPIDAFILPPLRAAGLQPSPTAQSYHLIRRVALDLTGLPPSLEMADAFANDDSPQAYEQLVERLLSDPAAAERWAAVWLDLARYADSAGYADDPSRTIWAYRDYVIDAFAANKPFDQFTIEQIAGDLLEATSANDDGRPVNSPVVATAFHRNTMTNNEGGTNDEEFRSAAIVDRVNTTFAVWMGTTMACAQCHTHKYDPITQKEYFQVYAILNGTADADRRNESPTVPVYSQTQLQQRADLQAQIDALRAAEESGAFPRTEQQQEWEASLKSNVTRGQKVRIDLPGNDKMLSLAEVEVWVAGKNVALDGTATQSSTDYGGEVGRAIDGNTSGDYQQNSVTHTRNENSPWWQVDLGEEFEIESIRVFHRTDGDLFTRSNGFRVSVLGANDQVVFQQPIAKAGKVDDRIVVEGVPQRIAEVAALAVADRTPAQQTEIGRYFWQRQRESLEQQLASIKPQTTVPVLQEMEQPRETFVQIRGNYQSLGERVQRGLPQALHPLSEQQPSADRLGLARWLVDDKNPLTARVTVNRLWEKLFGIGLVATSEEFGSQGELPSHPELLDWLAVEFIDSGWDLQHLVRLMVTSATYRQSSDVSAAALAADPFNRLLSRGPRFRVPAETVRDQALAASGLLSHRMFGPSVQPPRPTLGLKAAFGGSTDWTDSKGGDRYRRGLYTEWRRSMPYPSMATFDAPSREVCTLTRGRTNTPLQALVTLNDPVYIEAAQALGRASLRNATLQDATLQDETLQGAASPRERLQWMFRRCLIRPATDEELAALENLYARSLEWYTSRDALAMQMATNPLGPIPPNADASPAELAALTVVGNVLLNLDETLQKR